LRKSHNGLGAAAAVPSVIGGPGSDFTRGAASWLSLLRRRIDLWRRQGLANWLRSEFPEDLSQGTDARREREFVALNDVVKLSDEGGGFVVG
jgi:hypothetical protein